MTTPRPIQIFDNLHELLHLFRSRMLDRLSSLRPELTFIEMRLVLLVGQTPGVTQKELIERSHLDKAQMARTLANLQAQGLLQRSTSDQDKRIRCLHLSLQGQTLYEQLHKWQEDVAGELLKDWPAQMAEVLQAALTRAKQ